MDFYTLVVELIDMRSFSNLWYWIGLAVMWSLAAHRVVGVPHDMLRRARRGDETAARDVETLVGVHIRRILGTVRAAGVWLPASVSFVLTSVALLGFGYGVEFAQAVFLLAFPMSLNAALTVAAARRIRADASSGAALGAHLRRHRLNVQLLGLISIFVTAFWGMYRNLTLSVLAS